MGFIGTGFIDRNKALCSKIKLNDHEVEYGMTRIDPARLAPFGVDPALKAKCPSLRDLIVLLYNISLGQRVTTPEYANQFIDRHGKTFFKEGTRIPISLRQDSVTNISAIANYIQMTTWNDEVGAIEAIWDEYRFLHAGIAKALLDRLKKDAGADTEIVNDKKRNNIHDIDDIDTAKKILTKTIKTTEDALYLVEGIMMCCCWRDHSATDKDRHNSKIRTALKKYGPYMDEIDFDDANSFWCEDAISALIAMPKIEREIWIVKDGKDEITDILNPSKR